MTYYEKYLKYKNKYLSIRNLIDISLHRRIEKKPTNFKLLNLKPRKSIFNPEIKSDINFEINPEIKSDINLEINPEILKYSPVIIPSQPIQILNKSKISRIERKYKKDKFDLLCISIGFKNHEGECWNDAIQMFFCFQDGIKEIVQRKLMFLTADEIIELAELRGRKQYLPRMYEDIELYNEMKIKLKKYLKTLKDRFNIYYKREIENDESDSPQTPRIGINSAMEGLACVVPEYIFNEKKHTANSITEMMIFNLLQYVLLDEKELILYSNPKLEIIEKSIYNESLGSLVQLLFQNIEDGHLTLFYKCNNLNLYFDDNIKTNSRIEFNYKKYFDKINILGKNLYFGTLDFPDYGFIVKNEDNNTITVLDKDSNPIKNKMADLVMKVEKFTFIIYNNNRKDQIISRITNLFLFEVSQFDNFYNKGKLNTLCKNIKYYLENGLDINIYFPFNNEAWMFYDLFIYLLILGGKNGPATLIPMVKFGGYDITKNYKNKNVLHKILKITGYTDEHIENLKNVVRVLIKYGIDVLDYDDEGDSVLILAKKLGNKDIIKMIEDAAESGRNGIGLPHTFITKKDDLYTEIIRLLNTTKIHFQMYTNNTNPAGLYTIFKYNNKIYYSNNDEPEITKNLYILTLQIINNFEIAYIDIIYESNIKYNKFFNEPERILPFFGNKQDINSV